MDETGIRVRGRLAWLHVACIEHLSHFHVAVPALCAAHLLWECQDRVDFDDAPRAATMARLLRRGRRKRRQGHNLVLRLRNNREGVLRFTRDPTVPATNNEVERVLSPSRSNRRSPAVSAVPRASGIMRCCGPCWTPPRRQGWNLLETLQAPPDELIERLATRQQVSAN